MKKILFLLLLTVVFGAVKAILTRIGIIVREGIRMIRKIGIRM